MMAAEVPEDGLLRKRCAENLMKTLDSPGHDPMPVMAVIGPAEGKV